MKILLPILAFAGLGLPCSLRAAELLSADRPIEKVIDHYVDALQKQEKVKPAPLADDATVIRRLTLDLIGRIPTPAESRAFVEATDPDKKTRLVDRLMSSPAFVRHQAAMFDAMMSAPNRKGDGSLRAYFQTALDDNRSWSQIFRELVTPDEGDPKQKGSVEFLKSRVVDLDRLTTEVSVVFFGVNVSCAQCHDHPLVNDWKQDHFFGMKSFFSRTFDNGGFLGEREFGAIKFKPNKGAEKQATPLFLSGKAIDLPNFREPTSDEQKKEKERFEKAKTSKVAPPPPAVSARAKLVETALQAGNADFFSRSIVNRLWHRFLGFGLVNPLDQMHSENPPSHPELLQWLARDMAGHQYELRRMIRGIVLSNAYARSSKLVGDPIAPKFFAVARLKPLTPYQLATSMKIASSDPTGFENQKPEDLEKKLEQIESGARGFASSIAMPTDDFMIGVNEALLFSNNTRISTEFLTESSNSLLGRVKELNDPSKTVDLIVQSTLCRPATPEEKKLLGDYIQKRSDRQIEACRQVAWALITGAEFRFNH